MFLLENSMYLHLNKGVLTCYGLGSLKYRHKHIPVIFYRELDRGVSQIENFYGKVYVKPHVLWIKFNISTYLSVFILILCMRYIFLVNSTII